MRSRQSTTVWQWAALVLIHLYPPRFRSRFGADIRLAVRGGRQDVAVFTDALATLARAWAEEIGFLFTNQRPTDRREAFMSTFLYDVRLSIRNLARRPGFLLAAVLTLGLGIGANTSIFSVVNGILLRPLPYPEPDRLVNIWQVNQKWLESPNPGLRTWADRFPASMPIIGDWVELTPHIFEAVGGFAATVATRQGEGRPEEVRGMRTTSGVWRALGVPPLLGRTLAPDDDLVGSPAVIILAHDYWQQAFGRDSGIVGTTVGLDGISHTIAGVMPPGFYFPNENQRFWSTFPDDYKTQDRHSQFMETIARLRPGVSEAAAGQELDAVTARIVEVTGGEHEQGARIVPRIEEVVGDVRGILLVLLGAVGIVLLISCANIASLLLVRATERRRELAIRSALGAHRGRLVRQMLTESLVLGGMGGVLGIGIGLVTRGPLVAMMPPDTPRLDEITLDHRVLVFSVVVTLVTGLLVGALPALTATRTQAARTLRDSSRTTTAGSRRITTQGLLVIIEVALAFVLLVGGGLLTKSFVTLVNADRGFDGGGLATLRVTLRGPYIDDVDRRRVFVHQLIERLGAVPGVRSVTLADHMPILGGTNSNTVTLDTDDGRVESNVERGVVEVGYFSTLGIAMLHGREFGAGDAQRSERVAIVSRNMAEAYWPNGAVGRRLALGSYEDTDPEWHTVVGVVADVRHQGLDVQPRPKMYVPFAQSPQRYFTLALGVGETPVEGIGPAIRDAVWELEPTVPLDDVETMAAALSGSVASPRFRMVLVVAFAGLAGLLAILGIYGVLAFTVSQRTAEIGVRIALGAGHGRVLAEVVNRGLALSVIGLAVGFAITVGTVGVLEDFLFETAALDPMVLSIVAVMLIGAGLSASYLPARRALRVDPVQALRTE